MTEIPKLPTTSSNEVFGNSKKFKAVLELQKIISHNNKIRPHQQLDPSFDDIVYLILRLGNEVIDSRGFNSWEDVVVGVKRALPNRLNMIIGYRPVNKSKDTDE